jgi:phosphate transport system substrate-binding protein
MRNTTTRILVAAVVGTAAAAAVAETRLQGSGATFPAPLYMKWVAGYQAAHPDVKIDYQSIGSGGGIKNITDKTVHFAGSDAPMSKSEIEKAGGADNLVQVPSCAGGVVPAYNLPDVKTELKFTGEILADVYLGKISKWNDPKIAAVNEGVKLPDLAITPAWRTDGSGTTYVWTNYLCTQNEEFKSSIGAGKQVKFPIGEGGKGNEGVAAAVQRTPGTLGYIEVNYANANKIAYGSLRNRAGKFVRATTQSVSAAGAGAVDKLTGTVLAANIWDQPGDDAYPVASFTYLIVYRDLNNVQGRAEAQALVDFLWWATHDGQKFAPEMDYAPLAKGVQAKVETALQSITFKGEPLTVGR